VFDHPGLRVSAASPEHLLAMKVLAARRRDEDDVRFLVRHLGLMSVEAMYAHPQDPELNLAGAPRASDRALLSLTIQFAPRR